MCQSWILLGSVMLCYHYPPCSIQVLLSPGLNTIVSDRNDTKLIETCLFSSPGKARPTDVDIRLSRKTPIQPSRSLPFSRFLSLPCLHVLSLLFM